MVFFPRVFFHFFPPYDSNRSSLYTKLGKARGREEKNKHHNYFRPRPPRPDRTPSPAAAHRPETTPFAQSLTFDPIDIPPISAAYIRPPQPSTIFRYDTIVVIIISIPARLGRIGLPPNPPPIFRRRCPSRSRSITTQSTFPPSAPLHPHRRRRLRYSDSTPPSSTPAQHPGETGVDRLPCHLRGKQGRRQQQVNQAQWSRLASDDARRSRLKAHLCTLLVCHVRTLSR
jgi:hypothetical protein